MNIIIRYKLSFLPTTITISILLTLSCSLFCPEEPDNCTDESLPRIAFLRDRDTTNDATIKDNDIWIMDRNGCNQTQLSFGLNVWNYTFSPDGNKICFIAGQNNISDVYIMNSDGSDIQNLTNDELIYRLPIFTPNGLKLVFCAELDYYNTDIMIMDIDGNNKINLTNSENTWERLGNITPDGSKLIYISNHPTAGGLRAMFVMDISGNNIVCLTCGFHDRNINFPRSPQITADGNEIFFINHNGYEIGKIDITGNNFVKLYEVPNYEQIWDLKILPDNTNLSFIFPGIWSEEEVIPTQVFEINIDGSDLRNLSDLYGIESALSYSIDNKYITFSFQSNPFEIPQIYLMGRDYSNQLQLTKEGGQGPQFQPISY
ncbi:hypothetical protein KKF86_02420 [bacterium]|nr:hypothetical protein [bacterium]